MTRKVGALNFASSKAVKPTGHSLRSPPSAYLGRELSMWHTVSKTLLAIELMGLVLAVLFISSLLMLGPLGSAEDFGAISKSAHLVALLSVVSIGFLALGYMRSPSEEFVFSLDAWWLSALTGGGAALGNIGWGVATGDLRVLDTVFLIILVPLVHLLSVAALNKGANNALQPIITRTDRAPAER